MSRRLSATVFASVTAATAFFWLNEAILAQQIDVMDLARQRMVQSEVVGRGIRDPRVVHAMGVVPRHEFVPANQRKHAYFDAALPLGHGQTITSPFVVAFMTEQLQPQPTDRVLEIGTGSGYQAAVLSRIVAEVYSIEIVEPLGKRAARTLQELGYDNVQTRIGDGYVGWPEHAPFDKIIVTCSPEQVPPALVAQLREGGRLIVPLGERFQQALYLFQKVDGQLQRQKLEATFFVPMTGQAEELRERKDDSGWPRIVNGGFEELTAEGEPAGWFYARNARVLPLAAAPEGGHVLNLINNVPGQNSHAIQALGVDGRVVDRMELSARVWTRGIRTSGTPDSLPRVSIAFYDENRAAVRQESIGPWEGDNPWASRTVEIVVPGRTRLATLCVGMFGATGQMLVDDVQIRAVARD